MSNFSKGSRTDKWFFKGYQQALQDISDKLNENGEAAVREWLSNNLRKSDKEVENV